MDCAEGMVKHVISHVMHTCKDELAFLKEFVDQGLLARLEHVASSTFVRLTYTEAIGPLEKVRDRFEYPVYWGADLQSEHERYLTEEVFQKPVFLIDYPKEIKAFYMRLNDDGKTVAASDLLVPGIGELIGGSQREERLDVLKARMKELDFKGGGLRILPRSEKVRRRQACRVRAGIRADDHVFDRDLQHPRRDTLPSYGGKSGILI